MTFAKAVFWIAGIWGLLVITPLFFIFNQIGRQNPPPITHPGFYYGFATTALAWQIGFCLIARDPQRFRPLMVPSILEKFGYATSITILFFQKRIASADFVLGMVDLLLGILFLISYYRTRSHGLTGISRPSPELTRGKKLSYPTA